MGRQKLTKPVVKLIKHLKTNVGMNPYEIQREFQFCSRENIQSILQGRRWGHVTIPSDTEGNLLYWKWKNNEIGLDL
jgi:hypothetical protein